MIRRTHLATSILVLFLVLCCGSDGKDVRLRLLFEISASDIQEQLATFTLTLYTSPGDEAAFCAGWDQAEPWAPGGGEFYQSDTGNSLATEEDRTFSYPALPAETFGFTFVAVTADYDPADPKDLARGCTVVDLVEGPNPRIMLPIVEIIWPETPGECGDGTLDGDEACDDGNTVDDATCSADCLSFPAFQVNSTYQQGQFNTSLAGANGNYVAAWTSGPTAVENSQHVLARRFDVYGRPQNIGAFNTDLKLNTNTSQAQYRPDVAMGSLVFMALWLDNGPGTGTPAGDVRWRTMNIETGTANPEQTLNVGSTAGIQNWARVGGYGGATFFAAWISQDVTPRHAVCAFYNGTAWVNEDACSESASDDETLADAAASEERSVAGSRVVEKLHEDVASPGPDRDGGEVRVNAPASGACDYPAVAFDGTGRILVVWRFVPTSGAIQIKGRLFDDAGDPVGTGDFQINTTELAAGAGTTGNPNYAPDAAGDPETGLFLVVWDARSEGGGRGRIVLDHQDFGVNRYEPDPLDGYFRSTDDFAVTTPARTNMDDLRTACAQTGLCMAIWVDEEGNPDTDQTGIGGVVVPVLQPAPE
jgi:cysteine-rich repeat protein